MAANGEASMISSSSSISNGQEPSGHIPPLPPPLRSTQVFQPLSVFPVSNLSEDGSYDYVFGGPLQTPPLSSTLKLTSPPIRLRSDDGPHGSNVENGRSYRRSFGYAPKRPRPVVERESNASNKGHGEDEATLRQLLLEFA